MLLLDAKNAEPMSTLSSDSQMEELDGFAISAISTTMLRTITILL